MNAQLAIETRGLTKYYGGRPVVHALDLKIPIGCVYGFLGRNGAGKSTTIHMLTGMVAPDFGEASVLGENVVELSPATRARVAVDVTGLGRGQGQLPPRARHRHVTQPPLLLELCVRIQRRRVRQQTLF